MASATGSSTQNASTVRHRGPIQPGYVFPGSHEKPKCLISSRHGPAMQAGPLRDLCVELLKIEHLLVAWHLMRSDMALKNPMTPPERKSKARQDSHDLVEINTQMTEVARGDFRYHEKYPEDRYLQQYWWDCQNCLFVFARSEGIGSKWAQDYPKRIEDQSLSLQTQLIETAGCMELPFEIRSAIMRKLMILMQAPRHYGESSGCHTWDDLLAKIEEAQRNLSAVATPATTMSTSSVPTANTTSDPAVVTDAFQREVPAVAAPAIMISTSGAPTANATSDMAVVADAFPRNVPAVAAPATTTPTSNAPTVNTTSASAVVATTIKKTHSSNKLDLIFWLTSIATLISIPSIAVAYKYSDTEHGLWTEPDFWFLLQLSSFQFCGLLVTGLTLWEDASIWTRVAIGVGLLGTITGPVIYCFTPPFWGVMLSSLAGMMQSLVVLRGAIAEQIK